MEQKHEKTAGNVRWGSGTGGGTAGGNGIVFGGRSAVSAGVGRGVGGKGKGRRVARGPVGDACMDYMVITQIWHCSGRGCGTKWERAVGYGRGSDERSMDFGPVDCPACGSTGFWIDTSGHKASYATLGRSVFHKRLESRGLQKCPKV